MAYRVAIVDDSNIDAEYVQSLLKAWALGQSIGMYTQHPVNRFWRILLMPYGG